MSVLFLSDRKLLDHDVESVDTALNAMEAHMFGNMSQGKQDQGPNETATDTLRFLFGIFN